MDLFDDDMKEEAPVRTPRFPPKSKVKKQPSKAAAKVELKPTVVVKEEDASVVPEKEEVAAELAAGTVKKIDIDVELSNVGSDGVTDMEEEEEKKEVSTSATANNGVVAMEVEDEDQVVSEFDVFLTTGDPDTQLYVMQYPLRPSWRPYELEQRCTEVRVRPSSAEMEVDLSIDVNSDNYDPDSLVAHKMQKQTLSSSGRPVQGSEYTVGLLIGRKLYLNPIHAVVQLRPSMEYLDSGGPRQKKTNIAVKEESAIVDASAGSLRKQLYLNPTHSLMVYLQSLVALIGRFKSYPLVQNKQMDPEVVESWIPLKYHSSTSDFAQRYMRKMKTEEEKPLQFSMHPHDYLNSLCPGAVIHKLKSGGPSRRVLLSLPLEERIKTLLVEGPPVQRFNAIRHNAPDHPVRDVLQILQKYAHLVQGLWVAKTAIRYPKAKSESGELLARDYSLLLFHRNPIIKDSDLAALGSLKNVGKAIIREIAVERPYCKDWKFKEPTDLSFIEEFSDVVKHQTALWQDIAMWIEAYINKRSAGPNFKKPGLPVRFDESATRATTNACANSSSMPIETREALSKVLGKLFQTHRVCNFQTICQGLRDTAVSMSTNPKTGARGTAAVAAVKSAVDAPQEDLLAIISEFAIKVNGLYLLKPSTENSELDSLRNVVIDLFRERGPGAKLKKGEIIDAAKTKPTTNDFQKVINEYCVSQGGAWVLKNGDGVTQNDWQGYFKAAKLL